MAAHLAKKRFVGRVIPLVLAAFALAFAGVLVVDQYVEHRQIETSTHIAESTASTLRAANSFGRALQEFDAAAHAGTSRQVAMATLKTAQSNLEASIRDFQEHLDSKDRSALRDFRDTLGTFAESALLEDGTRTASLDERVTAVQDGLSVIASIIDQRGVAALRRAEQLDTLEGALEAGVIFFLASASVSLLFGWRRAEARARERDAQIEEQLRRTLTDLDAFAGRVAHDLRSPLAPILAGSQWIERAPVTDAVRVHAERIERSARRLGRLIEGLLRYTRASAGGADENARTPVNPAVEEVVADFEEIASARAGCIRADLGADSEVACAPEVVQSMVSNLVDNALKYGVKEGASPRVTIRTRIEGSFCVLEVEDSGPGVPSELRERVFQPFFRGQTAGAGVGLGLSIVRRLVETQRGRVDVLEGKEGGALFRISLPLAEATGPGSEGSEARYDEGGLQSLKRSGTGAMGT